MPAALRQTPYFFGAGAGVAGAGAAAGASFAHVPFAAEHALCVFFMSIEPSASLQ